MLNSINKIIILVAAVTGCLLAMTGTGTALDPYMIYDVNDLQAMINDMTAYYELANDIDASATATWNPDGSGGYYGFEPMGTEVGEHFIGYLEGNNHVISDLYIHRPALKDVSLFGYTDRDYDQEKSYIRNLGMEDVNITGGYRTAALVGRSMSLINNCYVTGQVTGAALNSVAAGLTAQGHYPITNCYSEVNVTAVYEAAGFIAFNNTATSNCYSSGTVSGASNMGGFTVASEGHGTGTATDCFWNKETSGILVSDGGTGLTNAQMKTQSTFTDAGWDFLDESANGDDDYWVMEADGFPVLNSFTGGDIPLPVTLSDFSAENEGNSVVLTWITETETNNLGFVLERSSADGSYIRVADYLSDPALRGAGSCSSPAYYTYIDENIQAGSYTYRLRDICSDGTSSIDETFQVQVSGETSLSTAFPNPFNPVTTISYNLSAGAETRLSVYDLSGHPVKVLQSGWSEAGAHSAVLDGRDLPSGVYIYRLDIQGESPRVRRCLLMK